MIELFDFFFFYCNSFVIYSCLFLFKVINFFFFPSDNDLTVYPFYRNDFNQFSWQRIFSFILTLTKGKGGGRRGEGDGKILKPWKLLHRIFFSPLLCIKVTSVRSLIMHAIRKNNKLLQIFSKIFLHSDFWPIK